MKVSNLKEDINSEITLKKLELIKHQENKEPILLSNKNNKIKKKAKQKVKNKIKNFEKLSSDAFSRTCLNCVHNDSQNKFCNLFKQIIYDDNLYSFNCDSYLE